MPDYSYFNLLKLNFYYIILVKLCIINFSNDILFKNIFGIFFHDFSFRFNHYILE